MNIQLVPFNKEEQAGQKDLQIGANVSRNFRSQCGDDLRNQISIFFISKTKEDDQIPEVVLK
jgi:hypothetical protein